MKKSREMKAVLMAGTLAMSSVMAVVPAMPAMAEVTYGTGSIIINAGAANADKKTNTGVIYNGYQIFKANVKDDTSTTTGKSVTNISWVSENVKAAVETVIKADAGTDEESGNSNYTGTTAQDAADYITGRITSDSALDVSTGKGTRVSFADFAGKLAKAVSALNTTHSVTAGEKTQMPAEGEGYWLFVTASASTDSKTDIAGTSPIFVVIGGSDVTVTEKTSIPTVDKQIKNDAAGSSFDHEAADSEMEQEIEYQMTGTVADNIATFETYQYKFTDTLPKAMTPDTTNGNIHVYAAHGTDDRVELKRVSATEKTDTLKTGYTVGFDSTENVLTISFTDLKSVVQASGDTKPSIDKDVKIVVEYQAKFDKTKVDDLIIGGSGNQNSVKLTYSNNPYSSGIGESAPKTATDYTYRLILHKIDRTSEASLAGAKFTIQATGADENAVNMKGSEYVQSDGSLGDTAYEFTTGKNGQIDVKGLDAGTYTVHETSAPDGYDAAEDFTFEIKPTYDGEKLTQLENVLTAADSVIAGSTDGDTSDNVMKAKTTDNDAADAASGTVKITVGDEKRIRLPLTGQTGIATGVAIGGFLVLISAAAVVRNKKKNAKE